MTLLVLEKKTSCIIITWIITINEKGYRYFYTLRQINDVPKQFFVKKKNEVTT